MKTAQILLKETIDKYNGKTAPAYQFKFDSSEQLLFENMMIGFAKMHLEEALKSVDRKIVVYENCSVNGSHLNRKSIYDSYPLENIK